MERKVVIIGAGPAGLTAAIYLKRTNVDCIIIEKGAPGGKMVTTSIIENYSGFKSISGPDLSIEMYQQVVDMGVDFIYNEVTSIEVKDNYKIVKISDGSEIKCQAIIIATGMVNRLLKAENEIKYQNFGVSYCAICDGAIYKGEKMAVVGSGNTAVEEAIFLSSLGKQINLYVRKAALKADYILIEHLKTCKNVEVFYNESIIKIIGEKKVSGILIKNNLTNNEYQVDLKAVFVFVGYLPINIPLLGNQLDKTANGFIITNKDCETSIEGIYATGDIIDKKYRQISTAISDGTIAALNVKNWLME